MGRYDSLVETAEHLREALAGSKADPRLLEAIVAIAQGGRRLGEKNARKMFTELVPDIAPALASNRDLRLAMDALQKVYDDKVHGVTNFSDGLDWLLRSRSQVVAQVRRLLAGVDLDDIRYYLHVTKGRALSFHNSVRNAYLPEIEPAFRAILGEPENERRMNVLLATFRDSIARLQQTDFISEIDFWKIKGEIMEMLTLPLKKTYLARHPGAVHLEGLMARTAMTRAGASMSSSSWRQIWDGVIAEVTGSGLKILVKFEVKSGLQGFREGFEQVLATHHYRFASFGDDLLATMPDGSTRVFTRHATKHARNGLDDAGCQNVLITPRGESWAMPNQILQKGNLEMVFQVLELGAREVDHTDVEALVLDLVKNVKLP